MHTVENLTAKALIQFHELLTKRLREANITPQLEKHKAL